MKRLLLVTGRPSVGKTTVVLTALNALKSRGYKIGGMLSREVRQNGTRVGFEVEDFDTGRKGWLAHVDQPHGPQVSKYRVNLLDLDQIGASAIKDAITSAEVIVIDEIGPMELFSRVFQQAVKDAVASKKLVLGVIHRNARDPVLDSIRKSQDAEIFEVTVENRQLLHKVLIEEAVKFLSKKAH